MIRIKLKIYQPITDSTVLLSGQACFYFLGLLAHWAVVFADLLIVPGGRIYKHFFYPHSTDLTSQEYTIEKKNTHSHHKSHNCGSPSACFDVKCQRLLAKAPHRRPFYVPTCCLFVCEFKGKSGFVCSLYGQIWRQVSLFVSYAIHAWHTASVQSREGADESNHLRALNRCNFGVSK